MPQPRVNPATRFQGPFLGLNTTSDQSQLTPEYATIAHNVLLSSGIIRPRAPWYPYSRTNDGEAVSLADLEVLSMIEFVGPDGDRYVLVKTAPTVQPPGFGQHGALWIGQRGPGAGLVQVFSALNERPADFVRVRNKIYVLDGSPRVAFVRVIPTLAAYWAGLAKPPAFFNLEAVAGGGNDPVESTLQYVYTVSNEDHSVESNPENRTFLGFLGGTPTIETVIRPIEGSVRLELLGTAQGGIWPPGEDRHFYRIYRRNLTLEQIAFRLIAIRPIVQENTVFFDILREGSITMSGAATGPFAPAKNGVPGRATVGTWAQNRLIVNDNDNPSMIRYSGLSQPEHFDSDDFSLLPSDESDQISGMRELGGQVFFGKRRGIWSLSGDIVTLSNEEIAQGVLPPPPEHHLRRTLAAIGPVNRYGNGFVLAGSPARLYFGAEEGFYFFDGVQAGPNLTDAIRPTWAELMDTASAAGQVLSYADDPVEGILAIWCGLADRRAIGAEQPGFGLLYHYGINRGDGVGVWTTFAGGNLGGGVDLLPTCIAPSLLPGGMHSPNASMVIGGSFQGGSQIAAAIASPVDPTAPGVFGVPASWHYRTGDMSLMDGLPTHVYAVKWLFSGREQHKDPDYPPPGWHPPLRLAILFDPEIELRLPGAHPNIPGRSVLVDLSARNFIRQSCGGATERVQLEAFALFFPVHRWSGRVGLVGWEIDAVPSGAW